MVDVVHLVEVDVIRLQALERGLDPVDDVLAGEAGVVRPVAHPAVHLGGHDGLVAPPGDGFPDVLLGDAARVDVRRVDEVDPDVERPVDDPGRLGLVRSVAEGVAAQPYGGHLQPALA